LHAGRANREPLRYVLGGDILHSTLVGKLVQFPGRREVLAMPHVRSSIKYSSERP